MKKLTTAIVTLASLAFVVGVSADRTALATAKPGLHMPWHEAGWSAEEAATHLLSRFTYGPRPGDVQAVVRQGLEAWFEGQLTADRPDRELQSRLAERPLLAMSSKDLFEAYPPRRVLRRKQEAQEVEPSMSSTSEGGATMSEMKGEAPQRARMEGGAPERQIVEAMMEQKLLRAVGSENQLQEVMVDFWFNHFNVSFTDPQVRPFLVSYERDALRPNALKRFSDLLEATARHPAMLAYLDNARSTAASGVSTTYSERMEERVDELNAKHPKLRAKAQPERAQQKERGVNENYARELMELQTLGVDGGYSQKDVTEVARAFTGWTVMPVGERRETAENRLAKVGRLGGLGFSRSGDFLFRADAHDAQEKVVLGTRLPAGRGLEDGEDVLRLLAAHRATARHLALKLAVRFVSDDPPAALVDRLSEVYLRTGGDVRLMLRGIVESPEFWSRSSRSAKVKSPFELAVSALRATSSQLRQVGTLLRWIARMGEPLYVNPVPTGYLDRASTWVNTGTLVTRMNFALDLAAGKIAGVELGERPAGLATTLAAPAFQRR